MAIRRIDALLVLAGTVALVACGGPRATPQPMAACRGAGSGFTALGEHELVYAVSHDANGRHLDAAVVVHASPSWRRRPPPDSQPRQWRPPGAPPRGINSGTAGPLWIGHERATGTVWLDSVPVPMYNDNVLLVEVGADDTPRVVGRARVEPNLPLSSASCGPPPTREQAEAFQQSVWVAVRRASVVRDFLER